PRYCQPESEWAALRNAQLSVLDLDNTGVATAIDLGNPVDIHPKNKQEVARRLSLLARNKTYGQDVACEAPKCVGTKVSGNKMTLTFDAPVHATSSAALGFIIGDKDGNWQAAKAEIGADGKTVTLTAPKISRPVAARYDWADYPNGNLYSADNLPVVPFATDK
ncbi:MAG: 9-O-acetylesterase, partial [Muribaculaceae bacterium]|nr:9-O-acetylesterase [Muribaculaceae bacterium]